MSIDTKELSYELGLKLGIINGKYMERGRFISILENRKKQLFDAQSNPENKNTGLISQYTEVCILLGIIKEEIEPFGNSEKLPDYHCPGCDDYHNCLHCYCTECEACKEFIKGKTDE